MKTWFANLSLREKQVVVFGSLLLALVLIYEMIFAPLTNKADALREKVSHDANFLVWMQATNQQIKTLEQSAQPTNQLMAGSLLATLQSNLNNTPFAKNISQFQQAEENSVAVKLQKIPFDEFTKWLIDFTQENQLMITQLSVVPTGDPGMVNLDLKLA